MDMLRSLTSREYVLSRTCESCTCRKTEWNPTRRFGAKYSSLETTFRSSAACDFKKRSRSTSILSHQYITILKVGLLAKMFGLKATKMICFWLSPVSNQAWNCTPERCVNYEFFWLKYKTWIWNTILLTHMNQVFTLWNRGPGSISNQYRVFCFNIISLQPSCRSSWMFPHTTTKSWILKENEIFPRGTIFPVWEFTSEDVPFSSQKEAISWNIGVWSFNAELCPQKWNSPRTCADTRFRAYFVVRK